MPRTALITGASGLLGRQVQRLFDERGWQTVGTGLSRVNPPSVVKLDITQEEDVRRVLGEVRPEVVVHCAANRFPDSCAADPRFAALLNVDSTHTLARAAHAQNAFFIYISTDYVFSGQKGQAPYTATAQTGPTNEYGKTKLAGEHKTLEVIKEGLNAVVLRVPVLYGKLNEGEEGQSAVNSLVPLIYEASMWKQGQEKTKMDDWAQRYPTNTADIGRVCVDIAEKYTSASASASASSSSEEERKELPRILQFSASERMTKYEICQKLADILGLPIEGLEPDTPSEQQEGTSTVQRPYDCHLDTKELRELGIDVGCVPFELWWRKEFRAFRH